MREAKDTLAKKEKRKWKAAKSQVENDTRVPPAAKKNKITDKELEEVPSRFGGTPQVALKSAHAL